MDIRETLTRLLARRKHTAVFPLDGKLVAIAVREGKCLASWSVPLAEDLTASFRALREKGMKARRLVLLLNMPELSYDRRKFPDMTDEELAESMYWEEDRLFSGDDPKTTGYRVLSHSTEGYDILFHGLPKDALTHWEEAAAAVGLHIEKALPVTDISISDDPHLALYGGRTSGALFFVAEDNLEMRHLSLRDEGKAARLIERIRKEEQGPLPCFLFPFSDAREEDLAAWKSWMQKEIESLPSGNEMVEIVELSDAPLRSGAELLALSLDRAGTRLPLTMAGDFLTKENRAFRLTQGLCLFGFLFFLFSWGNYFYGHYQLKMAEERNQMLAPVKEKLAEAREKENHEVELLEKLKELEKKSPHWETRLLSLADSMPHGIVLSSIKRDGSRTLISGTAVSAEPLQNFTRTLPEAWGGRAALKSRKTNQTTGLLEFVVEWKGESEG